jgi:hypothetical protein
LKIHINNFSVPTALASAKALASLMGQAFLINRSPQVMLLTINLDENFIDKEGIAIAEIESVVKPYSVLNNFWEKSISFVTFRFFHSAIIAKWQLTCQYCVATIFGFLQTPPPTPIR